MTPARIQASARASLDETEPKVVSLASLREFVVGPRRHPGSGAPGRPGPINKASRYLRILSRDCTDQPTLSFVVEYGKQATGV